MYLEAMKLIKNKLYLHVVFAREAGLANTINPSNVYGIDVDENSVTIYTYPDGRAITVVTSFSEGISRVCLQES